MKETLIYLIRHAESAPTSELPDAEWPLSPLGIQQAETLAIQFLGYGVSNIFSSPYPRAIHTVRPLAERLGIAVTVHSDLRERKLCEGLVDDWLDRLKTTWKDFDFAYPDGESSRSCQTRMVKTLSEISRANVGKRIAVGSHGNAIALFLHSIDDSFGFDEWRKMRNPDVFQIVYSNDRFTWNRNWKP